MHTILPKLEELIRAGMVDPRDLPILKRAIRYYETGMTMPTMERMAFYGLVNKFFGVSFGDPTIFRSLKQRILTTRTMKEAMTMRELRSALSVQALAETAKPLGEEIELQKAPEGMLMNFANIVKSKIRSGGRPTEGDKKLASKAKNELRRRRNVASKRMTESTDYTERLQELLQQHQGSSLDDLTPEQKASVLSSL